MMKPSEKTRSDLQRALDGAGKVPESSRDAYFRDSMDRHLGFLPASTRDALLESFVAKRKDDADGACGWLATVASILLRDYDGGTLSLDEWRELRDILSDGADELDIDILSYAMTLVLEHKAL